MDQLWSVGILFLLVGLPLSSAVECPQYCACYETTNGVSANCNYQRLTDMSSLVFPVNTFYLDFSFNALSSIDSSTIPDLSNLLILKIEHCEVSSISADSFSHLRTLQNVTLNGNEIQDIHPDAFRGLSSLRHLFLEDNKISILKDGVFDTLQLEQLYMKGNDLQQLTKGTFLGLRVSDVRLGGNKIHSLTPEILDPIKSSLNIFTLENNDAPLEIGLNTFDGTRLQVLKLRNSSISEHGFLKYVTAQNLDISKNHFKNFDFSAYDRLSSVENLKLAGLGIEYLEEHMLRPFSSVTNLDLSENQLGLVNGRIFRLVPDLTVLNLMGNPISILSNRFGNNLVKLEKLVMRGCKLPELMDPTPFLPIVNLKELDMGNNYIQVSILYGVSGQCTVGGVMAVYCRGCQVSVL